MGYTFYPGLTRAQAVNRAFTADGIEIIAKSGNWRLYRMPGSDPMLTVALVERHNGDYGVKLVDITAGPRVIPPAALARRYVAHYGGEITVAGGAYGTTVLRAALAGDYKSPGARVVLADEGTWSDGVPFAGEYCWHKATQFVRLRDYTLVRFGNNWQLRFDYTVITPGE